MSQEKKMDVIMRYRNRYFVRWLAGIASVVTFVAFGSYTRAGESKANAEVIAEILELNSLDEVDKKEGLIKAALKENAQKKVAHNQKPPGPNASDADKEKYDAAARAGYQEYLDLQAQLKAVQKRREQLAKVVLSGLEWFKKNQAKYPTSNKLSDLEPSFGKKAKGFVEALDDAGATVKISSTRRNEKRAHVMHYAWKLAKGQIKTSQIPKMAGVDIKWDHGGETKSRQAAAEMIGPKGFDLVHMPSLTSNHIKGQAIDMTISWTGVLKLRNEIGETIQIKSLPRNGNNKELHIVGGGYGMKKLVSDPPHWSHDGR